jgi:hypothetical protein
VAAVVLAANEGNVDSVMVAGRYVKRSGQMTQVDPRAVLTQAQDSQERILARAYSKVA